MHPALSVIFFTTASGAGYGLLALLGLLLPLGVVPADRWFGVAGLALGLTLVTTGLLSSTFHLGHPERAWRAVTQWRTSWLSREGVAALVTYVPAGLFAMLWVVFDRTDGINSAFGLAAAAMAVVTVYCTGMIYACLKPVHQWCNAWVVPNYLALALMTGALILNALQHLWGGPHRLVGLLAAASIPLALWLKERYWVFIDTTKPPSTAATATGLKGPVRLLEAPHTEENYLLKEMGFRVARKHAVKLRRIARAAGFAVPLVLTLIALVTDGAAAKIAACLAVGSGTLGVLVERWLFFAEAKHTVMLYYGAVEA
ncbi:MAG: dimethyl sulfoxide reductase anchor subunit [Proteobacteria bacterium]|nr:dimethyl sulfoxide reductase anchor subunit [Pseudomonadota bacterium]